ncbi:DUF5956 family protein [Gordonia sp. NPDC058843]|uniref:DUF5956 family protein n=1 Tax=Gordonia sp. NPDC058843 TaxID=3346648 RepID=UPI0036AC1DDA
MCQTWSKYQTVPAECEEPPAGIQPGKYVIAIENGHGALTAWAAGPSRCFRFEFPVDARPPVKTVCTDPSTGEATVRWDPFSEDDANAIAGAINACSRSLPVAPLIPAMRRLFAMAATSPNQAVFRRVQTSPYSDLDTASGPDPSRNRCS